MGACADNPLVTNARPTARQLLGNSVIGRRLARATLADAAKNAEAARAAETSPAALCEHLDRLWEKQEFRAFQSQARRFNALIGEGAFAELTRSQAKQALWSAEAAALSAEEVAALIEKLRTAIPIKGGIARAVRASETRLRFRRGLAERFTGDFTAITLGLHCLPWKMFNRWGLRGADDFHRTYNPFSLGRHKYEALVTDLVEDFANYAPADKIFSVQTLKSHSVPVRRDRGALWSHHQGEFWSRDGFAELLRDLTERLDDFRASARLHNPVFVMAMTPFDYPDEPIDRLDELHAALTRLTGGGAYHLLMSNPYIDTHGTRSFKVDDRTSYMYVPYPAKDYVWNEELTRNGREGLLFERAYAKEFRRNLVRWKLLQRREDAPPASMARERPLAEAAE